MTATTPAINVDGLNQQFESIKIAEHERHEFVEILLSHIRRLSCELQENTKALQAQQMLAKAFQDQSDDTEKQLHDLQKATDCNMFILVIIDGDDTLFKDDYIKEGVHGGQRAARDLQQALCDYLRDKNYFKHDYKIVTKIYLNLKGLAKTYSEAGIITGPATFQHFVQGFNMIHELMEIVDAGDGKEAADTKVKAMFNLFQRNLHCKHIILGGSGDNSYGSFLRPHAPSSDKSKSITLIEGLPFARELRALSSKFEIVKFEDIFRDTKIEIEQPQRQYNMTRPPPSTSAFVPALEPSGTAPATYAKKLVTPSPKVEITKTVLENKKTIAANKSQPTIYVNNLGQRIDKPIKNLDKDLAYRLKQRRLCNKYHLVGKCSFDDGFCEHEHGPALTAVELNSLQYVARFSPCDDALNCVDPNCSSGHRCQYGTKCAMWGKGKCWFSDQMHTVDVSGIKAVPVNT